MANSNLTFGNCLSVLGCLDAETLVIKENALIGKDLTVANSLTINNGITIKDGLCSLTSTVTAGGVIRGVKSIASIKDKTTIISIKYQGPNGNAAGSVVHIVLFGTNNNKDFITFNDWFIITKEGSGGLPRIAAIGEGACVKESIKSGPRISQNLVYTLETNTIDLQFVLLSDSISNNMVFYEVYGPILTVT